MATVTQADFSATGTWADIVAAIPATASVNVLLQNKGDGRVQVVFGGSQPTDQDAGLFLLPGDTVQCNAAALWVRAPLTDAVGVITL